MVLPARLPALLDQREPGNRGRAWRPRSRRTTPREVGKALLKLLKNPEATVAQLTGPGRDPRARLPHRRHARSRRRRTSRQVYRDGGGSLKLRGSSVHHRYADTGGRGEKVVTIDEVPYGVNKGALVLQIAEIVNSAGRWRCCLDVKRPLHRGGPGRPGDEEGHRRGEGPRVPLQEHLAWR